MLNITIIILVKIEKYFTNIIIALNVIKKLEMNILNMI